MKKKLIILISCFVLITILIFIKIFFGNDLNPDERHNFTSAQYYFNEWMPPAICDPKADSTYSEIWGTSRLNDFGLDYFLSGKFARIAMVIIKSEFISARLFSGLIFFILVIVMISMIRRDEQLIYFYMILFLTPQAWLMFSYTNNDAFPLFLSFIAVPLFFTNSGIIDSINKNKDNKILLKLITAGIVLGILMISKRNYLVFVLYTATLMIAYLFRFPSEDDQISGSIFTLHFNKKLLIPYITIGCAAALVAGGQLALDYSVNGPDRDAKIDQCIEKKAKFEFKLSTIKNAPEKSYDGYRLKDKGVSLTNVIHTRKFFIQLFASFFGSAGYMTAYASKYYYYAMFLFLMIFSGYVGYTIMKNGSKQHIFYLLLTVTFLIIMLVISLLFSWIEDFQPQGRYLFPVISILGLFFYKISDLINKKIFYASYGIFFVCSIVVYVFLILRLALQPA